MLRRLPALALLLTALAAAPSVPGDTKPPPTGRGVAAAAPAPPPSLSTANESLGWALEDLHAVLPPDRPFTRWLWIWTADENDARATIFALNVVSRASIPINPVPVQAGRVLLLRVDLRTCAPRPGDLADWLRLWEELAHDPKFSLLLTRDTIAAGVAAGWPRGEPRIRQRRPGKDKAGRVTEIVEELPVSRLAAADVVRLPGEHLDQQLYASLAVAVGSAAPVVSADYFLSRALASIKDAGPYATIYGGLYYDLVGVRKANDEERKLKATDLDVLLDGLGIGNIKAGLTFEALFARLRTDHRIALVRSDVTGKDRVVIVIDRDGGAGLTITLDLRDQDIDIGKEWLFNLRINVASVAALEVIWIRANGHQGYALYNGAGELQVEAPPDVVKDHKIPEPYTARLQAGISCIRCHGPNDGWQPLKSDARTLLAAGIVNPFAGQDRIDRELGLYSELVDAQLSQARDRYAAGVLRGTGPWAGGGLQVEIVRTASARAADIWADRHYKLVDAATALRELGLPAPPDVPAHVALKALLPREPGILVEDPRLVAITNGVPISRSKWDLVYSGVARRIYRSVAAMKRRK